MIHIKENLPPAAKKALGIYEDALHAIRAGELIRRTVSLKESILKIERHSFDLNHFSRILLLGVGKASTGMGAAMGEILQGYAFESLLITKKGYATPQTSLRIMETSHPIPDESSIEAGEEIHTILSSTSEDDLVIFLLSGGASALMELPVEGVSLTDLRSVTQRLLESGANIAELNSVRQGLSRIKSGGLARAAHKAKVICLCISDVMGNDLSLIGSGPFFTPSISEEPPLQILYRFNVLEGEFPQVFKVLRKVTSASLTPFVPHVIIGDIHTALDAAAESARKHGMHPLPLTDSFSGEARNLGANVGGMASNLEHIRSQTGMDCLILGGETTVTVRGAGKGGRSQEVACAAALVIDGVENIAVLSAGTDGSDGPTDAAGGLIDGDTVRKTSPQRFRDALARNDTYSCLQEAGALLITGPTDSNVGDVVICVLCEEI